MKIKWWYWIAFSWLAAVILRQILPRTAAVEAALIVVIFSGGLLSIFGAGCDRDSTKQDG